MSMKAMADNPYLELYRSCGVVATEIVSKEAAHKISSSIAQMHNALGHAINDLVRMLAQQFSAANCPNVQKQSKVGNGTPKGVSPKSDKSGSKSKAGKTQNSVFSDSLQRRKEQPKLRTFQVFNPNRATRISEKMEDIEDSSSERKNLKGTQKVRKLPSNQPVEPPKAAEKRFLNELVVQEESKQSCSNHSRRDKKFHTSCNQCDKFYQIAEIDVSNSHEASSRHAVTAVPSKIPSFSQNFEV